MTEQNKKQSDVVELKKGNEKDAMELNATGRNEHDVAAVTKITEAQVTQADIKAKAEQAMKRLDLEIGKEIEIRRMELKASQEKLDRITGGITWTTTALGLLGYAAFASHNEKEVKLEKFRQGLTD